MQSRIVVYTLFPYPIIVGFALLLVVFLTGAQPLPEPSIPELECDEPEVCFRNAVYFADSNPDKWDLQLLRFQKIQEKFPDSVWAKRAGLRIGLTLENDHPAQALTFLKIASRDFPLLKDYIELHQGEALRALEKNIEAAELLESLMATDTSPVFQSAIMYRAGQARYKAQQCRQALPLLRKAHASDPKNLEAPQALYAIAECVDRLQLPHESQKALQELWWRYPESPEAKALDEMPPVGWLAELNWTKTPRNYYQRANSYMKLAQFEQAIADFTVYIDSKPRSPRLEQGQFHLAMAYVRLKRYPMAEQVFHALATHPSSWRGKATEWLARVYLRQGKGEALLDLQNALPSRLSRSRQSQINWMCGIWFEDKGNFAASIQSYKKAAKVGGSAQAKAEALWRLGWLQFQQGKHRKAVAAFQSMDDRVTNRTRTQQAQYWQARALGRLGKKDEAQGFYRRLAVDSPVTYYGQLARQHIGPDQISNGLTESSPGFGEEVSGRPASYLDSVSFQKSEEFRQLGLMSESSQELMQAVKSFRSDQYSLSQLAIHLMESRAYDSALVVVRRYFREQIERGELPKSSPLWQVAYPRGYLENIQAYADPIVDPYLVAGIIREESLYDPRALSPVGAMGLMQLMPETASRVANQLGMSPFQTEDLFRGDTNIRLGVGYVAQLLKKYEGNLAYTVAAYNAGPHVVARWIAKSGDRDPDEFIELISYKETRRYVKRVLTSYRAYHFLSATTCSSSSLDMSC